MLKDYVSTSIFLFNCYLCLGTLHEPCCKTMKNVIPCTTVVVSHIVKRTRELIWAFGTPGGAS